MLCCLLLVAVPAVAAGERVTVAAESIRFAWIGERHGRIVRLFEADPVARLTVADPDARQVDVLLGQTLLLRTTVPAEGGRVDVPISVARVVPHGRSFSLTVRATGSDGTAVEQVFGPVEVVRATPAPVIALRWRWGSPTRVRLDWRVGTGDTPPARFVVRAGRTVLFQLPADTRLLRVTRSCQIAHTLTVASVSADDLEGVPASVTVPAGSCALLRR